jgi:hypothetical protein
MYTVKSSRSRYAAILATAAAAAAAMLLSACATSDDGSRNKSGVSADSIGKAAAAPLNDLNIVRADIPEALRAAVRNPYAAPADKSCPSIAAAVQALDAVLGADLDTPPSATNPSLVERGTEAAGNAAVGAIRSAAEGAVPFRGWVRKISGAERYSREVAAAIAAGTIRRAYLKGLGQQAGCAAPAAPVSTGSAK